MNACKQVGVQFFVRAYRIPCNVRRYYNDIGKRQQWVARKRGLITEDVQKRDRFGVEREEAFQRWFIDQPSTAYIYQAYICFHHSQSSLIDEIQSAGKCGYMQADHITGA